MRASAQRLSEETAPGRRVQLPRFDCPRCWRPARAIRFTSADYAELLGLYLGDGCISGMARTHRLRISLDTKYPAVVTAARALLQRSFPENAIGEQHADRGNTTILSLYSRHLPCLFPQHGLGKKHLRRIALEEWQLEHLEGAPWAFIRGCIRSDGCVFINRTGRYSYLSYEFSNLSVDLLRLFSHACALVGVRYRIYEPRVGQGALRRGSVRICQRPSVGLLQLRVGDKGCSR